jgi:tRNA(Ile)-lysidine synthase
MHLAAAHCRAHDLHAPVVFTVDHQLRPDTDQEARMVHAQAAALGLQHHTLTWRGAKPRENIQHAARMARYSLMGEAMRAMGLWALLTGHTLNDQAETFLLRIARGSGLDGLSGMAPLSPFPMPTYSDMCLMRPLLGFSKSQILGTVAHLDLKFVEDPSNANPAFARTRVRSALDALISAGVTAERIAEAAARLRQARAVMDEAERSAFAEAVEIDPWGFALVTPGPVRAQPRETVVRLVGSVLRLAGGQGYPPERDIIDGVYDWLVAADPVPRGRTAGGCRLWVLGDGRIVAAREQAALDNDEPLLVLRPGQSGVWDGRFRVGISEAAEPGDYVIQALGPFAPSALKVPLFTPSKIEPRRIASTYPGVFIDGALVAVPTPPGLVDSPFSAQFIGRLPVLPEV